MPKHVKHEISHSKGRSQVSDWTSFIGDLEKRLAFHEQRVKELRLLIPNLKRAKSNRMPFPESHGNRSETSATTQN